MGGIPPLQGVLSRNQGFRVPPSWAEPHQCQAGGPRASRVWQYRTRTFPGETPGCVFPRLSTSPLLACAERVLPCPALPGWFSIALKPALAAAKAGTGRVCSISTPAWCEELPRCPAPAELVGQKVPFSAGPVACLHSLQPVLSLVQSFPGLRFTSSRTASSSLLGVLD